MNIPKISVLMAIYNGEKYLKEAIESILNQSFTDFEFLIINDGSTDSTIDIIDSYKDNRICLVNNQRNIGLTKSLNIGFKLAKGEYIARMDADDVSMKDRLKLQVEYLDQHTEIIMIGTQAELINETNRQIISNPFCKRPSCWDEIRYYSMLDNPFVHSSVMFRVSLIQKYGLYNEAFRTSQDYELWSRFVYHEKCVNLKDKLVKYRTHNGSVSKAYNQESYNRMITVMDACITEATGINSDRYFLEAWVFFNAYNFEKVTKKQLKKHLKTYQELTVKFNLHNRINKPGQINQLYFLNTSKVLIRSLSKFPGTSIKKYFIETLRFPQASIRLIWFYSITKCYKLLR